MMHSSCAVIAAEANESGKTFEARECKERSAVCQSK